MEITDPDGRGIPPNLLYKSALFCAKQTGALVVNLLQHILIHRELACLKDDLLGLLATVEKYSKTFRRLGGYHSNVGRMICPLAWAWVFS